MRSKGTFQPLILKHSELMYHYHLRLLNGRDLLAIVIIIIMPRVAFFLNCLPRRYLLLIL